MMNNKNYIPCLFITEKGELKKSLLPKEFLVEIATSLREDGVGTVHFESGSVNIEGLYIPAKGSKYAIMLIPIDEEEE